MGRVGISYWRAQRRAVVKDPHLADPAYLAYLPYFNSRAASRA